MSAVPARAGGIAVRRAWPGKAGTQTVEGYDDAGRLRAGVWSAGGELEVFEFGQDRKLPGLVAVLNGDAGGERAELLVHRARRRAVVRVRGEQAPDRYVKLLRPGTAPAVAAASTRLGELVRAAGGASAEVLEVGEDRVVFGAVPGRPLRSLDPAAWRAAWEAFAEVWPRVVVVPSGPAGFARHDARAEADVVTTWVGRLREHDPLQLSAADEGRLEARSRTAIRALTEAEPQAAVVAHRDLHDEQLLFDAGTGRVGFLDFDTAALAEPALDLANLQVHLDLRLAQGLITPVMRDVARRVVQGLVERCGVAGDRLEAYAEATRVRLIGVYGFRPPWRSLALDWLRSE